MCLYNENIYLFGGIDLDNMLNDLYFINPMNSNTWNELHPKGNIPEIRCGSSMNIFNKHLYILGG